jgi:hypothetical protein
MDIFVFRSLLPFPCNMNTYSAEWIRERETVVYCAAGEDSCYCKKNETGCGDIDHREREREREREFYSSIRGCQMRKCLVLRCELNPTGAVAGYVVATQVLSGE